MNQFIFFVTFFYIGAAGTLSFARPPAIQVVPGQVVLDHRLAEAKKIDRDSKEGTEDTYNIESLDCFKAYKAKQQAFMQVIPPPANPSDPRMQIRTPKSNNDLEMQIDSSDPRVSIEPEKALLLERCLLDVVERVVKKTQKKTESCACFGAKAIVPPILNSTSEKKDQPQKNY